VTNIALDYVLIFGYFGFPELGIEGAAIASLAAEFAILVFLMLDCVRKHYIHTYGLFRFGRWDSRIASMIVSISTPVSLEALVETLRWFGFFLIIERMGEAPLAAANIVYSCYALFLLATDAFDETVASMVSNLIGQGKEKKLSDFLMRVIRLCYTVVAPVLLLSLIFPDAVLAIFTEEDTLIDLSINSLYVVILTVVIAVPASTFYSAVVGTGDTVVTFFIQLAITVTTLLFAYYAAISLGLSLEYVWLAEVIGWVVCLLLASFWFRSGFWQRLQV
jgi:Na+-driven multidrug efflux pump